MALVRELVNKNIEVLIFCREKSERNRHIPKHPLVKTLHCSLDELSQIQNTTGKTYDVFYHFAWMGTTGMARNDIYLQNQNVRYALDAVGAAKRFGCHTFIGAGSQAEYGRVEGILKQDTPAFPETGYGIAKLCACQMTKEYACQLGIRHIWVRILSVYGPDDRAQSMIMSTIHNLQNGEVSKFTKGEQIWDYLYSGDAGHAFCLIGEKGVSNKIYVLGSGKAKPLASYIRIIRDIVAPGATLEFGALPYGAKQVMHLCADVSELEADTGWKAETEFPEGINKILATL